jgi:hypothetical protein
MSKFVTDYERWFRSFEAAFQQVVSDIAGLGRRGRGSQFDRPFGDINFSSSAVPGSLFDNSPTPVARREVALRI